MVKLYIILFALIIINLSAQPKKEPVENAFINKNVDFYLFNSNEVKSDLHIYIKVPDNYSESNNDFPVLYVLDGDIVFPIAKGVVQYLLYGKYVPDLIIVGIGYGTLNEKVPNGNNRSRDYSPTQRNGRPNTGKAEQFLTFLKDELIPFVDDKYRTDKNDRILQGHSMGGLFATYALLTSQNVFNRYIISSPYLWWDDKSIFTLENEFPQKDSELKANVFISYGEDEDKKIYADTINEMISYIENKSYNGLKLEKRVFEHGEHFKVPSEALTYGLISIFEK